MSLKPLALLPFVVIIYPNAVVVVQMAKLSIKVYKKHIGKNKNKNKNTIGNGP